ncbi:MAG: integrase family protein [Methyloceanibacter sp.]
MSRRKRLDDDGVAKLKPKAKRYAFADPELPGHYVRVQPNGSKSFVVVTRDPRGKQHWRTVGAPPMPIDDARDIGRKIIRSIREAAPDSFEGVASEWFKRHVVKKGLRSGDDIQGFLQRHITPAWTGRDFTSIKRKDIAALLDHIEDEHGARQADYALDIIRRIANWHATRDDNYNSPVVRGMRRTNPKERERTRILSDDEIRIVWSTADAGTSFGGIVKMLLVTGQRLDKVTSMRWDDLNGNVWAIRTEAREKGNAGELILPDLAMVVVSARQRGDGLVFPSRGGNQLGGLAKYKRKLDRDSGVSGWVLHDLRRSARSLMSRAGVRPDIAERVMGHSIRGVEGVYDRHPYAAEKAEALKLLAGMVRDIVTPPPENVRKLKIA